MSKGKSRANKKPERGVAFWVVAASAVLVGGLIYVVTGYLIQFIPIGAAIGTMLLATQGQEQGKRR